MRVVVSGYEHFVHEKRNLIASHEFMSSCKEIIERGETLYDFASKVEDALVFQGRGPVYVVPIGFRGTRVAVRHSMRGGFISKFVKDKFLPPTRALRELFTSIRLRKANIATPEVVAVATYPSNLILRTSDVVTRYIEGSADLASVFGDSRNDSQRRPILDAVAQLLGNMTAAGVQHEDLNLKNILITAEESGYKAHLLDVDRAHFHVPNDPMVSTANMERIVRSLKKWRETPEVRNSAFPDEDINYLNLAISAYQSSIPTATVL